MATFDQLVELRGLIAEPLSEEPWTDEYLSALLDANTGDVRKTASSVWTAKAASTAHLVDISEGGSSRKMSDVHKNAIAMAKLYATPVEQVGTDGVPVRRGARTRAIERP